MHARIAGGRPASPICHCDNVLGLLVHPLNGDVYVAGDGSADLPAVSGSVNDSVTSFPVEVPAQVHGRMRNGEAFIVDLSEGDLRDLAHGSELYTLIMRLRTHSLMSAPIVSGGELIGSIMLSAGPPRPQFTAQDLAITEELGT